MEQFKEFERLEGALVRAGRDMEFPATPALAQRVRAEIARTETARAASAGGISRQGVPPAARNRRRALLPLAAAIVLALALLLAVPTAREAIGQFLGLRGLRIFYETPTPLPTATATARPRTTDVTIPSGAETRVPRTPTVTPRPTATPTVKPFTLCCETTLEDAQRRAHFKLVLPPNETPGRVYYQGIYDAGEQVVMVFGDPEKPRFTLYQAQSWVYGKVVGKAIGGGTLIGEAQVKGKRALWFSGAPHLAMMLDANGAPIYDTARVVDANTLVWDTGDPDQGIVYRLETKLDLREAVRIAESLE